MNDIEARLRDAYRAAAATISPDTTRELGEQAVTILAPGRPAPRRGRGRIVIPLAAAAAVAVTAALAAVLPGVLASPHRPGQQVAGGPVPQFAAQLDSNGPSPFGSVVIRDLATGASVASVAVPAPGLSFNAIATGDGTNFVAVLGHDGGCGAWFYQFQLNRAGRPSALTPYKLAFVRQSVVTIALSGDNGTFAYLGQPCPNSRQPQAWLTVLNPQTNAARRWAVQPALADASMPLALTANGGLLAYGIAGNSYDHAGVYTLRTSAAPGPALQRSREVAAAGQFSGSDIRGYAIAADASTLYLQTEVSTSNYAAGHHWQILAIDLATGQVSNVAQFPGASTNTWTPDSSGSHALVLSGGAPAGPGEPAPPNQFLVVDLVTGQVLRNLDPAQWAPTSSLFAW